MLTVTSNAAPQRLHGLDHLRALAIIMVFLYHYRLFGNPPLVDDLGSFGWTGVDLFFVLSGYLIGGQLLSSIARGRPLTYGEFYFKRSMRILPAYFVVLILYFTIPAFTERSHLPPLWKFLTFTSNFNLDLINGAAFSHAWSLCIEEQFYLFFPIIVLSLPAFIFRKGYWLLILFFIAGLCIRLFCWFLWLNPILETPGHPGFVLAYYRWIYYPTFSRLDGLLMGVSLAALFQFAPALRDRLTRHGNLLLLLGLALLRCAWLICREQYSFPAAIFGFPLISLAYGVMVLAALSPGSILYRIPSRVTTYIATLSYSLYLTHKQMIHLTHVLFRRWGWDDDNYGLFWLSLAVSLAAGMLLHYLVEKPFLKWREGILSRSRMERSRKEMPSV